MYNLMHVAMNVPIEKLVTDYKGWATFDAPPPSKK
jgi:hypothetical protein